MENRQTINYNFLVTGAAGFIGSALVKRLIKNGESVIGIDNLNSYYDKKLKISRLADIKSKSKNYLGKWKFIEEDLENYINIEKIFKKYSPKIVFNLAAQAGVRYSLKNPSAYIKSNLVGFSNLIELSRLYGVTNFIYASSSSVYGNTKIVPFNEDNNVDHPISLYAATKRSNELIAHSYSHLFKLPTTGLRYFTVYGPWGRPDMAPILFTKSILEKKPIKVFNHGDMMRDFTFIDDVISCTFYCGYKPATANKKFTKKDPKASISNSPYRIFNVGNNKPVKLGEFIKVIENELNIKAIKDFLPIQPGDVEETFADISKINEWTGFKPQTNLNTGIKKFINWYKNYYKL